MSANPFKEIVGRYLDFTGRTSRKSYWLTILLAGVLIGLGAFFASSGSEAPPWVIWADWLRNPIASLIIIAIEIPFLSMSVRRLHDVSHSGWWVLANFTGIGALLTFYWSCKRGVRGPNRFGPDPLLGPASLAPTPADDPMSRLDQLKELGGLKEGGVLSDEEFASEKARLLGGAAGTKSTPAPRRKAVAWPVRVGGAIAMVFLAWIVVSLGYGALTGGGYVLGGFVTDASGHKHWQAPTWWPSGTAAAVAPAKAAAAAQSLQPAALSTPAAHKDQETSQDQPGQDGTVGMAGQGSEPAPDSAQSANSSAQGGGNNPLTTSAAEQDSPPT